MDIRKQFSTPSLKSEDVGENGLVAVIEDVIEASIKTDDGLEQKIMVKFEGEEKHLVLNKTNSVTLSLAYGAETDDWRGKEVELYVDPNVEYMGRKVGGIRVRALQKTKRGK